MYTYYPASWSAQARKICDNQIALINAGWQTIDGTRKFFSSHSRNNLIMNRAAKRFGRAMRAGKIHENLEEYRKHFD